MKTQQKKMLKTAIGFALSVFVIAGCNGPADGSSSGGGGGASAAVTKLKVSGITGLVAKYDPDMPEDQLRDGGWFEPADKPSTAPVGGEEYKAIDPKRTVLKVMKYSSHLDPVQAEPNEFKVKLLNMDGAEVLDNNGTPTTKVPGYGEYKLQIVWNADASTPVEYTGAGASDGLVIEAVAMTPPSGDPVAFTIVQPPEKTEYDWKETLNLRGLEVTAWYDAATLAAGGIPVKGVQGSNFNIDSSKYAAKIASKRMDKEEVSIYVKKTSDTTKASDTPPGPADVAADFKVVIDPKSHSLSLRDSNGDPLENGQIETPATAKTGESVIVTFKTGSLRLDTESVKLVYNDGKQAAPAPASSAGNGKPPNSLNLIWNDDDIENAVNGTGTVPPRNISLSFEMPASDVTLISDYNSVSIQLAGLSVGAAGTTLGPIFGFNTNTLWYTYILPYEVDDSSVALETAFAADADGATTEYIVIPNTVVRAMNGSVATFSGIKEGDTTIAIKLEKGGASRTYTVVVKKMDATNTVTYTYAGEHSLPFSPPEAGNYLFEAWGAFGGNMPTYGSISGQSNADSNGRGGKPAKVTGILALDPAKGEFSSTGGGSQPPGGVYVYIGGGGQAGSESGAAGKGGWNGGGNGGTGTKNGAGGGGATSVSLLNGAWQASDVLLSRILVAGGGGGYGYSSGRAGAAGGLVAQGGKLMFDAVTEKQITDNLVNPPFTTILKPTGYWSGASQKPGSTRGGQGFGIGGTGPNGSASGPASSAQEGRGGGGGGYFGGEVSGDAIASQAGSDAGGGGGSSYISGFSGCISYTSVSGPGFMVIVGGATVADNSNSETKAAAATHYSGYTFSTPTMTTFTEAELFSVISQTDSDSPAKQFPPADNTGLASGLGENLKPNYHGFLRITKQGTTP